jgi:hypothetical protein
MVQRCRTPPLLRRRHLQQAARRLSTPLLARELRGVFGMDPGARRGCGSRRIERVTPGDGRPLRFVKVKQAR